MAVGVSGGDKAKAALAKIAARVANYPHVRVGFLEKATYPDGTPVAMVAAIQNFGAPRRNIPPRPFFTAMIAKHKAEWGPALGRILKAQDYDAPRALRLLGEVMAGQLRQSVVDTNAPPLSPVTLMLRRMRADNPALVVSGRTVGIAAARVAAGLSYGGVSTKPLVDRGILLNAIDSEVRT